MTVILLVVVVSIICGVKRMFWDDFEIKDSLRKKIKKKIEGE